MSSSLNSAKVLALFGLSEPKNTKNEIILTLIKELFFSYNLLAHKSKELKEARNSLKASAEKNEVQELHSRALTLKNDALNNALLENNYFLKDKNGINMTETTFKEADKAQELVDCLREENSHLKLQIEEGEKNLLRVLVSISEQVCNALSLSHPSFDSFSLKDITEYCHSVIRKIPPLQSLNQNSESAENENKLKGILRSTHEAIDSYKAEIQSLSRKLYLSERECEEQKQKLFKIGIEYDRLELQCEV